MKVIFVLEKTSDRRDKLKRITVWIDSKDENIEQVCKRLEKFLSSVGFLYKIVDVCELKLSEDGK